MKDDNGTSSSSLSSASLSLSLDDESESLVDDAEDDDEHETLRSLLSDKHWPAPLDGYTTIHAAQIQFNSILALITHTWSVTRAESEAQMLLQ